MKIDPLVYRAKFPESCRIDRCRSRCCRFGVWADTGEMKEILANSERFVPYVRPEAADPSCWFGRTQEDRDCPSGLAVETRVVGEACAFLHPAHGCALQMAAIDAGLHPWRFKPRFCVMFPLVISEGTLTVDEEMKSLWCMREKNRTHPIIESVRAEVRYLFGEEMAQALLSERSPFRITGRSQPRQTPAPHRGIDRTPQSPKPPPAV